MKTHYISPNIAKTPSPIKSSSLTAVTEKDTATTQKPTSTDNTPIKKEPFTVVTNSAEKNTVIPGKSPKKGKGKNRKLEKPANKKMAQTEVPEGKMTELKILIDKEEATVASSTGNKQRSDSVHKLHRKNSGRDSANHSPSDVMLASSSLSSMSDNHSEGSSDSGKGGSDLATPPASRTPQLPANPVLPIIYDFLVPQTLVGKLIGRHGSFVQNIKDRSNTFVYIRKHPTNNKFKLCSVEGTQADVDKALKLIREKFPPKKYPEVTLEQVQLTPTVHTVPLIPDYIYLKLIEGINNDTIVSCMVAPDHLFMQQPAHPSFPTLSMLTNCMNLCYMSAESPMLPRPIPQNTVCVAYSVDSWYRVMVLSTDEATDTSYVKFMDFGGYAYVENENLRQIRRDFIMLPFQAAECFLANVLPKSDDGSWSEGAYNLIAELTKGSLIYTQVAGYTPDDIPLVLCYIVTNNRGYINVNRKLCEEGYARWTGDEEEQDQRQEDAAQSAQLENQPPVDVVSQ